MTIIEAITQVMRQHGRPMTAREAYDSIVSQALYEFHAQNPAGVVIGQVRRHSEGIDFPTANPTKYFRLVGENRFVPLDSPARRDRPHHVRRHSGRSASGERSLSAVLEELQRQHAKYIALLRERIVRELRRLSPAGFEGFARRLLAVYGFEDTCVTRLSGDGGIDGYGRLKVGLAYLNVAFQCKRWTRGKIQRTEIDKFRGAAQGDFEQGVFFATTSFSTGAIGASIKRGAIPVVLVDSAAIVQLMIDKQFGVQAESLTIPTYALDLAIAPDLSAGPTFNDEPSSSQRIRSRSRRAPS